MADFNHFVSSLNLANFSAEELLVKTQRPLNHRPEEVLWPNIAPTILVLQKLRTLFGVGIVLTSVYRSYEYNEQIPDAGKRSQHIAFNAIDFVPANPNLLDDMAETLIAWRGDWIGSPQKFDRSDVIVEGQPIPNEKLEWKTDGGNNLFKFRGGVRLYGSFIHVDTRGIDANW
ncbi:MAG: D-Ala-D-Ala carboxypeptidase family metallohydrolase [Pseudomonadota bacterium]